MLACGILVRLETPVATAISLGSTIELDSMSSTQWPAVRITRGATTVPVQAYPAVACTPSM